MKVKYIIIVHKDDKSNPEVVFKSNDLEATKKVYKMVVRVQDLSYPQSDFLRQERDELIEQMPGLYDEDEMIEDEPLYYETIGIFEMKEVK